jgi:hypothetical protein
MKTFRKLSITLNGSEPETLIKKLETQCSQYWFHNVEQDRHLDGGATVYCFAYSENADKPPARLYFMEKQQGIFSVTNILPTEKYELSYDEYNALVLSFHEELVMPAVRDTSLQVEITQAEIKLEDFVPKDVADSLQAFSLKADKYSGYLMPSDEQRWFQFITYSHCKKPLPTNILEKALEEEGWESSMALSLAEKYETDLNLLAYYDTQKKWLLPSHC